MTSKERTRWFFLTGLRALPSVLDLIGILAVGYVITSLALDFSGSEASGSFFQLAGFSIPGLSPEALPWVAGLTLALFLSKAVFSILLTKRSAYFVAHVEARAARDIAKIMFGGHLQETRRKSREEVLYAVQVGSPAAFNSLLNSVNTIVTEATLFALVCIGFFLVDPWVTLAAIVYFGIITSVMQFFLGSKLARAGELNAQGSVAANVAVSDLITVFRELLVLGGRGKYIQDLYRARKDAASSSAAMYYLNGMPRYIIETALIIGVSLFVLSQSLSGDLSRSAGVVGVFLSGGFRLTAALLPLQNALLTVRSVIPLAATAQEILRQSVKSKPSIVMDGHGELTHSRANLPIGVEFSNVSFTFLDATTPALQNISFKIEPGSQLALIGPSGAGKSTIADLICQVLTPSSGRIRRWILDGKSETDLEFGRVSYVPQRPGLVSGTILDNIALAVEDTDVDLEAAIEALKLVQLYEVISELPLGINTPLGKMQDGFSGGQMQRLGLARALYTRPGLLVMDEATSALDSESESEIQIALEKMRGKVTVVLIAHRLNTIQHADRVLLIEHGSIGDSGPFKDLVSRNISLQKAVKLMRVENENDWKI